MIRYIDRQSGKVHEEKVYFEGFLHLLYAKNIFSRFLCALISKNYFFSNFVGWWQNRRFTRRKIAPFVKKYALDATEFEKPVEAFTSFNDFFIRTLKKEARPVCTEDICMPADGRYLFFPHIGEGDTLLVKGKKFSLSTLLQDPALEKHFKGGSMVLARLCPSDYHRFHFPLDCVAQKSRLINGFLYSVNPYAVAQSVHSFTENKRVLTVLETAIGKVLFMEVGATNVGSIHQTYKPGKTYRKGDMKGFFSFGGSALIVLFEPKKITFDPQLLQHSQKHLEIRCLMGQFLASINK